MNVIEEKTTEAGERQIALLGIVPAFYPLTGILYAIRTDRIAINIASTRARPGISGGAA